jgi:hypothetical protein
LSPALRLLPLLGLDAALAATLLWLFANPVDVAPVAPRDGHLLVLEERQPESDGAERPDFSGLARNQVVARPLFAPDRRPWLPPAPPPEPVTIEIEPDVEPAPDLELPPDFILLGIGIANGEARALLLDQNAADSVWVTEGESVGGWIVTAISDQSVTVEQDGRALSLTLYPEQ